MNISVSVALTCPAGIPAGYNQVSSEGKYYKLHSEVKSWIHAMEVCSRENGTLVTVKSEQDHDDVDALLGS